MKLILKGGLITEIESREIKKIGNNFLCYNKTLTRLELPKLTKVGSGFLLRNEALTRLELPELTKVGDCFAGSGTTGKVAEHKT